MTSGDTPNKSDLALRKRKKVSMSDFDLLEELSETLKCSSDKLETTILKNLNEYKRLVKLHKKKPEEDEEEEKTIELSDEVSLLIKSYPGLNPKEILSIAQNLIKTHKDMILVTIGSNPKGLMINGLLGEKLILSNKINLGQNMRTVISEMGGKGGGKNENFQGFLPFPSDKTGDFQQKVIEKLQSFLSKVVQG